VSDANGDVSDQEQYDELSYYTLAHPHPSFIHQHVVDAFAAQHADEWAKPMRVAFALAGLYLHLERGFTGKAVQQAHTRLARAKEQMPVFQPTRHRASMTVADVLLRRTRLGLLDARSVCAPDADAPRAVAKALGEELGWDEARVAREVAAWHEQAAAEGLDVSSLEPAAAA